VGLEEQVPKRRLTTRQKLAWASGLLLGALGAAFGVRACIPPETPLVAAQRDLAALGCAPGGFIISAPAAEADDASETSWGYHCFVDDASHAPDCDAVAARWAASAHGGLAPFDVVVSVGDPRE
jgi:hypothetical protein